MDNGKLLNVISNKNIEGSIRARKNQRKRRKTMRRAGGKR